MILTLRTVSLKEGILDCVKSPKDQNTRLLLRIHDLYSKLGNPVYDKTRTSDLAPKNGKDSPGDDLFEGDSCVSLALMLGTLGERINSAHLSTGRGERV